MLTIEQLKFIRNQLSFPKSNAVIPAKCAADHANELLIGEIRRLTSGPFTLAEAIASGRPFRREGWGGYVANGVRQIDGAAYFYSAAGGESLPNLSDITACDYELAPDATDVDKLRSGVLATEYHCGTWRVPTAEGASPQAVVTYTDSASPETGHVGWCWWALGKMGQSPTYTEARLAAEAALEKDVI